MKIEAKPVEVMFTVTCSRDELERIDTGPWLYSQGNYPSSKTAIQAAELREQLKPMREKYNA